MRWSWLIFLLWLLYYLRPIARNAGRTVGAYKVGEQPQPAPVAGRPLAPIDPLADCYRALDLQPTATIEEVRASYRELVKVWHPDRFGSDNKLREKATKKMSEINSAYDKLMQNVKA